MVFTVIILQHTMFTFLYTKHESRTSIVDFSCSRCIAYLQRHSLSYQRNIHICHHRTPPAPFEYKCPAVLPKMQPFCNLVWPCITILQASVDKQISVHLCPTPIHITNKVTQHSQGKGFVLNLLVSGYIIGAFINHAVYVS